MTLQDTKGQTQIGKDTCIKFITTISNIILDKFNLSLINNKLYYIKDNKRVEIEYTNDELVAFLDFKKIDAINKYPCSMYEVYSYIVTSKFFNKNLFKGNLKDTYYQLDKNDAMLQRMYISWYKLLKSLDKPNPCLFTTSEQVILKVIENNFKDAKNIKEKLSKPTVNLNFTVLQRYADDKFKFENAVILIPELATFNISLQLEVMEAFKAHVEKIFLLKYNDYLTNNLSPTIHSDFIEFYYDNKERIINAY